MGEGSCRGVDVRPLARAVPATGPDQTIVKMMQLLGGWAKGSPSPDGCIDPIKANAAWLPDHAPYPVGPYPALRRVDPRFHVGSGAELYQQLSAAMDRYHVQMAAENVTPAFVEALRTRIHAFFQLAVVQPVPDAEVLWRSIDSIVPVFRRLTALDPGFIFRDVVAASAERPAFITSYGPILFLVESMGADAAPLVPHFWTLVDDETLPVYVRSAVAATIAKLDVAIKARPRRHFFDF